MNEFTTTAIKSDEAFRETAEKGVAQVKDTYEKAKVATEQATDILKDTYATAAKGATEYNLKIIEIARTNTNSAFEHAQQLLGVKSPSEFVELSTAHARKQFDTMIAQTKVRSSDAPSLGSASTSFITIDPEHTAQREAAMAASHSFVAIGSLSAEMVVGLCSEAQ